MTDNAKYIQRGINLFVKEDPSWKDDLKKVNRGKERASFQYADAMTMMTALRTSFGILFRQLSGLVSEILDSKYPPYHGDG